MRSFGPASQARSALRCGASLKRRRIAYVKLKFLYIFVSCVDRYLPDNYNHFTNAVISDLKSHTSEIKIRMKKHILGRFSAGVLAAAFLLCGLGRTGLTYSVYAAQSAMVSASSLNIRSGPGTSYRRVSAVPRGTAVTILGETTGSDGNTWAEISVSGTTGYVLKSYLIVGGAASSGTSSDSGFESQLSAQGFPESYKTRLRAIHSQYPNWVFHAFQTGIDWEDAVKNESVTGRNLVANSSISSWKSTAEGAYDWSTGTWPSFDSGYWVAASEGVIRYYMDPRNFLDSSNVFQFLSQSYDASSQTASGVELLAQGTFLQGTYSGGTSGSTAGQENSSSSGSGAESSGGSSTNSGGTAEAPDGSRTGSSVSLVSPSGETSAASAGTSDASSTAAASPAETAAAGVLSGAPQGKEEEKAFEGSASAEFRSASVPDFPAGSEGESETSLRADARAVVGHGASGVSSSGSAESSSSSGVSGASGSVSYIDLIMEAAEKSRVNPYVLTSMILQEQGKDGKGTQISGTNSSYPGIYNFFNIEAYSDGSMTAAVRGLWWASQSGSYGRPWNSIEKAIVGGAQFYAENFTSAGQNTFYTKKFNVTQNSRYQHQYMTNVKGAADEGLELGKAYTEALRAEPLTFDIPVYSNMPEEASALPTADGSPNNRLKSLGVDGFSITPTFDIGRFEYDLIVDSSVSSISVSAQTVDSRASVSGTGSISLGASSQDVNITVTAENGNTATYVIHVTKQQGGQTGSTGNGNSGENTTSGAENPGSAGTGSAGQSGSSSDPSPAGGGSGNSGTVQLVSPSGN